MSYRRQIQIEFNHCDPAGIVFYPRYFEMVNSVVENFFADEIDYPFARMLAGGRPNGVPAVHLAADFMAPSRLGDGVEFTLSVRNLGRSSVTFAISGEMAGEPRLSVELTVVWTAEMRAARWPDAIRSRLERHLETET